MKSNQEFKCCCSRSCVLSFLSTSRKFILDDNYARKGEEIIYGSRISVWRPQEQHFCTPLWQPGSLKKVLAREGDFEGDPLF